MERTIPSVGAPSGAGLWLPRRWIQAVYAFAAVAFVISTADPHGAALVVGPVALALTFSAASVVMYRRSSGIEPRERLAWRFVSSGLALGSLGIVAVALVEALGAGAPAFGPLDVFFLAAYLATLVGFALLPQLAGDVSRRLRLLLDALIGGVSVATVLWIWLVRGIITEYVDAPLWDRLLGFAYPVIDLAAFVVVMIVVVRRSEYRFDPRMLLLAGAISLQAVADIAFLHSGVNNTFQEADPLFPLFILAGAAFLGTAILVDRRPNPREFADRRASLFWMLAPYSAAAIMVVLLVSEVMDLSTGSDRLQVLLGGTLVVGALVIARQAAAIRENRDMVEKQRAALVSSISHELRTPLTAMVGFLALLDDPATAASLPEAERREMLSTVHAQSTYLGRIVHDLVMLARGNLDQMELVRRPVDIGDLVRAAVASVDLSRADLLVDVPEDEDAFVDADRIQQVLVNLLSNAQRYGGSRVEVRVGTRHEDLWIEVHDDGPGVPKKYELAIWERFERGPNRLNATVPGSGIGLAVVDAIARGHGGAAEYRPSERLGGACFSLVLPGAIRHREPAPQGAAVGGTLPGS